MTATNDIKPGAARVSHIQGHLLADPIFKSQLGPMDAKVARRDGITFIEYHRLSVQVTMRMLKDGVEPMQAHKSVVGDYARIVLDEQAEEAALGGATAPAAEEKAEAPAPKPTTVAEPVATPPSVAPAPVEAAAAPKAAAPKKAAKKVVAPVAAAPAAPVVEPKAAPAPAAEPDAESEEAPPAEPKVNIQLAVYSLIMAAQELAERDQQPGANERRTTMGKVAKSYRDVLVI